MTLSQVKSQFKGAVGADLSFSIAAAFTNQNQPFLIVFESKEIAAFHLNDLELLLPKEAVLFLSRQLP
jgi:transcription-repair coupling factor (superfamily II helicase)